VKLFVFHLAMSQTATYVAASSVAVDFMRLLFVLSITVNPVIFGYTPVTRRFILSAQEQDRCSDFFLHVTKKSFYVTLSLGMSSFQLPKK